MIKARSWERYIYLDSPIVGGQFHCKDGKLVTLKAVLEGAARCVHAVVGRHQGILLDPLFITLTQQVPDVVTVLNLRQKSSHLKIYFRIFINKINYSLPTSWAESMPG